MNRLTYLIDGFNLYHSLKDAQQDLGGISTRWLNLHSLFSMYTASIFGRGYQLEQILYFSAFATHRDKGKPGVVKRHKEYIECLRSTGIKDIMGRFKPKWITCHSCNSSNIHHEEKETDVAISMMLLELFHFDACDTIVLVTGDTDLAPAVRTAKRIFPYKEIVFAFPYKRKNEELKKLVATSFYIKKERYIDHQFPEIVTTQKGKITKLSNW